jgi:hypothetical protein
MFKYIYINKCFWKNFLKSFLRKKNILKSFFRQKNILISFFKMKNILKSFFKLSVLKKFKEKMLKKNSKKKVF